MNTRKYLAALAALVLAGSSVPAGVIATAEGTETPENSASESDSVVFTAENYGDHIKITGYTGSADIASIPSVVGDVPVTEIGGIVAGGSIRKILIPASVTTIADNAFSDVRGLEEIEVNDENTAYSSESGVLYNKDRTILVSYPNSKPDSEFTTPESVTEIADKAFFGSELAAVTVTDNVVSVGKEAFSGCYALTSAVLGAGLKEISENTFADDESLSSVTISSAEKIGDGAFAGCSSLKSVALPENTSVISATAFSGCSSLTDITVSDSNTSFSSTDGILFSKDGKTLVKYGSAREDSKYEIPDSVSTVADKAFEDCVALTTVTIGRDFESFEGSPFAGCTSLTDFEVYNTNKNFAALDGVLFTFGLTELVKYPCGRQPAEYTIPDSVTKLDPGAFTDTTNVTAFSVSETNENFTVTDGVLFSRDGSVLVKYPSGAEADYYAVPETVTAIDTAAFDSAENLEGLSIIGNDVELVDGSIRNPGDLLVLYGNIGSSAEAYASANGIEFIALDAKYAFGDVNADGSVDSSDASNVLSVYALVSTGHRNKFIEAQQTAADIGIDGVIDSSDASMILVYYAYSTTTEDDPVLPVAEYFDVVDPTSDTADNSGTESDNV